MRRRLLPILSVLIVGILFLTYACGDDVQKAEPDHLRKITPLGTIAALPLEVLHPGNNPVSKEKVELGRLLFYDPVLSGNNDVSCASCHHPEFGYAENIELSIGVSGQGLGYERFFRRPEAIPFTKRNSQSLLNIGFNGINPDGEYDPLKAPMFWDLRATSLEEQSLHPIRQFEEMRGTDFDEPVIIEQVLSRLRAIPGYQKRFAQVFGPDSAITETNLAKAIACFERTLVANQSKFDQYMRGETSALTISEKEGMDLFVKVGCARCHNGPMLSDFKVHVIAAPESDKRKDIDSGFNNSFAFRTPTLRNLRFTAPYMHSGKIASLEDVLTFYEDLRGKPLRTKNIQPHQLDTLVQQVKLEFKDISRILEFLNALNDRNYDKTIPPSVPSGLPVGGDIVLTKK
ncbi:MAG TPA: cytochrome-c peroxidase [Flavitalea sp.]|nr:cytochrome-c peroxidase [Flavitalea sp.]